MKRIFVFSFLILLVVFAYSKIEVDAKVNPTHFVGKQFSNVRKEMMINNENYLVVSTDKHLYMIQDQKIVDEYVLNEETIFVEVLNDLNHNNYDELLIITNAKDKDNILLYDTKEMELIFSYASKMRAYNAGNYRNKPSGYYDETVVVEDYVLNQNYFYAVAGYNAFLLDLQTQTEIWQYKATNNLWDIEEIGDINQDNMSDYIVSLQKKSLIALSGINGEVIYQKTVSESIEDENGHIYETSIWNMQYDKENNSLYAASENGKIYQLDVLNGQLIDKKEVVDVEISPQHQYNSTYGYYHFKKYSVELINDITGDGIKDLIYYQMTRPYQYKTAIGNGEDDISIQFIDGNDLTILDNEISLTGYQYGIDYLKGMHQNKPVFYILDLNNRLTYKIYSIEDQSYLEETISLQNQQLLDHNVNYSFLPLSTGEIAIFSNLNLSFQINDTVESSLSMIKAQDYIIEDGKMLLMQGNQYEGGYINLKLIDCESNELFWSYDISEENRLDSTHIDYTYDFNQDGVLDIVILNIKGSDDILPWVLLIDGSTGQKINKINISLKEEDIDYSLSPSFESFLVGKGYYQSYIKTHGFYNDVNHDGINELFVINNLGDLYIIDFINNEILDYFSNQEDILYLNDSHYTDINFRDAKKINDIDNDSLYDFIRLTSTENSEVILQTIETNQFSFEVHEMENYGSSHINSYYHLGDIDSDGINDPSILTMNARQNKGEAVFHIISSKTGLEIATINAAQQDGFYLSQEDINSDGLKEVFHIKHDLNQWQANVRLYDISEDSIETLFESQYYQPSDENFAQPAVIFKDQNHYKIAFYISYYNNGDIIKIYDIDQQQFQDDIKLHFEDNDADIRYSLGNLGIVNHGDDIYFYPRKNRYLDYYDSYHTKSFVYHYTKEELSFYYSGNGINHLDIIDKNIILRNVNSEVFKSPFEETIDFNRLKNNQKINKNITLSFKNKQKGNVYIYVNDELVGRTDKALFDLKLLEGKHTITISQINEWGVETVKTVNVVVTNNYFYKVLIFISTVVLFSTTIILPRKKKRYPLPKDIEGSDEI